VSKSIRVDEDVHETLASLKGDDETFNDVLARLLRDRRETIESGAGLWEGTDAAEAARAAREDLKEDVGAR
jgi:predicted CopG family antitoxin